MRDNGKLAVHTELNEIIALEALHLLAEKTRKNAYMRTHTRYTPYKWDISCKNISRRSTLKTHILVMDDFNVKYVIRI